MLKYQQIWDKKMTKEYQKHNKQDLGQIPKHISY